MHKVVFVDVCQFGKLIQCEVFFKVVVNIPAYQGTFPASLLVGRSGSQSQVIVPQQQLHDDFKQMLADQLIAGFAAASLLQHQPQVSLQFVPTSVKVRTDIALCIGKDFQTGDPEHNILHRAAVLTQFGMGNAGVDDHQILFGNWIALLLQLETSLPADNEKQFGMRVGVQGGIPLAAILCPRQVK